MRVVRGRLGSGWMRTCCVWGIVEVLGEVEEMARIYQCM